MDNENLDISELCTKCDFYKNMKEELDINIEQSSMELEWKIKQSKILDETIEKIVMVLNDNIKF